MSLVTYNFTPSFNPKVFDTWEHSTLNSSTALTRLALINNHYKETLEVFYEKDATYCVCLASFKDGALRGSQIKNVLSSSCLLEWDVWVKNEKTKTGTKNRIINVLVQNKDEKKYLDIFKPSGNLVFSIYDFMTDLLSDKDGAAIFDEEGKCTKAGIGEIRVNLSTLLVLENI